MNIMKTSVLSGLATTTKILVAFIINKAIAVYVGPSGLAIVGQLQNFIAITLAFSNGAITQGVVKYTAEYRDDLTQKKNSLALL